MMNDKIRELLIRITALEDGRDFHARLAAIRNNLNTTAGILKKT
jgi:hypothetical protein